MLMDKTMGQQDVLKVTSTSRVSSSNAKTTFWTLLYAIFQASVSMQKPFAYVPLT